MIKSWFNFKIANKNFIFKSLRILFSFFLLVIVFYQINLLELITIFKKINLSLFFIALSLTFLAVIISTWRWQIILKAQGQNIPLLKLIPLYFVGLFFNNFFPTSIGGDVVRVYHLSKVAEKPTQAVLSVITERLLGSAALGLTAIIGVFLSLEASKPFLRLIFTFAFLCLTLLFLSANLYQLEKFIPNKRLKKMEKFWENIKEMSLTLKASINNKKLLYYILLLSLAFQITIVLINILIFKAFGFSVSPVYCFLFIPIISALSMLPVSINGLGVREGSYVFFFSKLGLPLAYSLSVSLTFFFTVTLVSLIGGLIFAFQK